MKNFVSRFVKDESGATAIEYGLLAGLISIVIITAVTQAGGSIKAIFEKIRDDLADAKTSVGT